MPFRQGIVPIIARSGMIAPMAHDPDTHIDHEQPHEHEHAGRDHAGHDHAGDPQRQVAVAWHSARWLPVAFGLTRPHLPAAPAAVVDIGCGPFGGIVPALIGDGYDAVGVDPGAPSTDRYRALPFGEAELPSSVAAITASLSLHHIDDLDGAVGRAADALGPDGVLVVLEMDWPAFDDAAAEWCFAHLPAPDSGVPAGWLAMQRDNWQASGVSWSEYRTDWATEHGLHTGDRILSALDARFECVGSSPIPYYFSQLVDGVTPEVELAAIEAGDLPQSAFRYVGRPR